MFFLLRVAFWLSIVVLLLPAAPGSKDDPNRPQVGAIEALGAAKAAVEDARGFCSRQPDACVTGSQAFHTFGQKAQNGAKILYEFLTDRFADAPATAARKDKEETGSIARPGRHTLTQEDTVPAWRGPEARPVPLPARRPS
ncbi:MAG TPA: DUF5330 domain-containing protein [Xanthobacteraceae bacterium]|nr:DUF5330 domain-containing protein [Xanthobacteraceae bacterium]